MAFEVTFKHGNPLKVDYTPTAGDVAAGQVVVVGAVTANMAGVQALACVAHSDIPNNVKGSLAAGGGVYTCVNLNNAADGALVFWSDSVNKVTTVSTNNAQFGVIAPGTGGGGANSNCDVIHQPIPSWDD